MATKNATPRQARTNPTLKAWVSNEANIEQLKAILENPAFVAATSYVIDLLRVTSDDLIGAKAELPEVIVRKAAMHAGSVQFLDSLKNIIQSSRKHSSLEPEAWEHIHPPTY